MEVVEMRVNVHCKACETSVRKALCKLKGVTCVDVDVVSSRVTVLGYVNRSNVVRAVRKTGQKAEAVPKLPPHRPHRRRRGCFPCLAPKVEA